MAAKPRSATLFEAAGLESEAPRPLADRLRPSKLSEVVGQDHLLGPEGAIRRNLRLSDSKAATLYFQFVPPSEACR